MEASTPRKQVGRSPRYPGIDLERAVERAHTLFDKESHYAANTQIVLQHWGYAPKSGGGAVTLAALKAFGLIDTVGTGDRRTAHITTLAEDILNADNPLIREEALRKAALSPQAHRDIWENYGASLPSEVSLEAWLRRDKGFTPGGARELIAEYKKSIAYAGLTGRNATVSPSEPDPDTVVDSGTVVSRTMGGETIVESGTPTSRTRVVGPAHIQIPIPLPEGMGTLSIPRHVSTESLALV
jgi:hypothetical protein